MKWQMGRIKDRILAFIVIASILVGFEGIPVSAETGMKEEVPVAARESRATTPSNPVHHCTKENDGSDYTDWDYVYFGSYPQTEVSGNALTSSIIGASYDSNGDAWVNGVKYRKISKSNTNNSENFGDSLYRYFKWERIKWRVLKNNGSTLFLMADKGLDCKCYNDIESSVSWETCTLRSWLNNDFYNAAFNSNERNVIVQQINKNGTSDYGTLSGNDTRDKVFLPSISEMLTSGYGFCEDGSVKSVSRRIQVSDYAYARGAVKFGDGGYNDYCRYWMRSIGTSANKATLIYGDGHGVAECGVDMYKLMCAPILHINLSSNIWFIKDDGTSGNGGIIPAAPTIYDLLSQNVKQGNSVIFSVIANGGYPSNYTYQWYYATSQNGTGTKISGATSSSFNTYATASMDGRYYYCIVSNGAYDVTSGRAKLTVYSPPSVTMPESSPRNVKEGDSISFSVNANGGNPSRYTYQWYYVTSSNGIGVKVGGATASSYNIFSAAASMDGRYYYCIVSNGQYDVTSIKVKVNVEKESKPSEGGDDGENPSKPPEGGGDKNEPSKPPASGGGTVSVLKAQKITASSYTKTYGSKPFSLNARTNGNGKLTYKITNHAKAVTVSADGKITVKGYGQAKIAIKASQTANYKAASKTVIVKVVPKTPAMPQASSPSRRKMGIKWKKDKTVTAYELQISKKSDFKSQTIKRYYNRNKTQISVTGFPSGRTYYVRMRCYKTLGKNKYYGKWSKVRKVRVK